MISGRDIPIQIFLPPDTIRFFLMISLADTDPIQKNSVELW